MIQATSLGVRLVGCARNGAATAHRRQIAKLPESTTFGQSKKTLPSIRVLRKTESKKWGISCASISLH